MKIKSKKQRFLIVSGAAIILLILATMIFFAVRCSKTEADDFDYPRVKSTVDFNNNGTDDYTDIMLGARIDAQNEPTYDPAYFEDGYPPEDIGVCTDVVWRAFKNAGYNLKDMVDADIQQNTADYTYIETPDPNIDFRRVVNLRVYFNRFAERLSDSLKDPAEWQPGDIVIFGEDEHIGIVSDKRNKNGIPYLIHNAGSGQKKREENVLEGKKNITGHYRFDASKIPEEQLLAWEDSNT